VQEKLNNSINPNNQSHRVNLSPPIWHSARNEAGLIVHLQRNAYRYRSVQQHRTQPLLTSDIFAN